MDTFTCPLSVLPTRWRYRVPGLRVVHSLLFSLVAGSEVFFNKGRLKWMTLFTEMRVSLRTVWTSFLV